MRVLIFGATGMIGQGVLRECLLSSLVHEVHVVGRTATGIQHPKLHQVVMDDLFKLEAIELGLTQFDACFFCLGVSAAGMSEAAYTKLTYGLTIVVARKLLAINPTLNFIYVSGAGTDSTEKSRSMWARVKGRTENALLALPFKSVYLFRPGAVQPVNGEKSKNVPLRVMYQALAPLLSLVRYFAPRTILTTEILGRSMISVASGGAAVEVLESADIYMLAMHGN